MNTSRASLAFCDSFSTSYCVLKLRVGQPKRSGDHPEESFLAHHPAVSPCRVHADEGLHQVGSLPPPPLPRPSYPSRSRASLAANKPGERANGKVASTETTCERARSSMRVHACARENEGGRGEERAGGESYANTRNMQICSPALRKMTRCSAVLRGGCSDAALELFSWSSCGASHWSPGSRAL